METDRSEKTPDPGGASLIFRETHTHTHASARAHTHTLTLTHARADGPTERSSAKNPLCEKRRAGSDEHCEARGEIRGRYPAARENQVDKVFPSVPPELQQSETEKLNE